MDRRLLLAALACWPASRALAQEDEPRPRHQISAGELHEALSAKFPLRARLGNLLELEVSAPRLHLLPARNRLGAALALRVGGLQVPRLDAGELDVVFALRYEAGDQTVRGHHPEILDVRWPGLPPELLQALRSLLPAMARDAMGEVVLHQFSPRELALPDTMGFEPEAVTVVDDGLVI